MRSADDIEGYLMRMEVPYEEPRPGVWIVRDPDARGANVVVSVVGPLVVFRVKLLDLPPGGREPLFEKLLRLNATEMLHGSYGIAGSAVVIEAALQLENCDFNEFQATLDDINLALGKHHPEITAALGA